MKVDPESKKMWRLAGSTGAIGMEIGIAISVGYFGGRYLDSLWGTEPWLFWIGLYAGLGASVKALVRVTRQYKRQLDSDEK